MTYSDIVKLHELLAPIETDIKNEFLSFYDKFFPPTKLNLETRKKIENDGIPKVIFLNPSFLSDGDKENYPFEIATVKFRLLESLRESKVKILFSWIDPFINLSNFQPLLSEIDSKLERESLNFKFPFRGSF